MTDRMNIKLRPASVEDLPFMAEMLVEAAYPPLIDPKPTPRQALEDPMAGRYLRDWGRIGDVAVIAESPGEPVGAAWFRRLTAAEPGYGYVADDIPEIAIAVRGDRRGTGVGRSLLAALIDAAAERGERALSLNVSNANPVAAHLYATAGFVRVSGDDRRTQMVLSLQWESDPQGRQSPSV